MREFVDWIHPVLMRWWWWDENIINHYTNWRPVTKPKSINQNRFLQKSILTPPIKPNAISLIFLINKVDNTSVRCDTKRNDTIQDRIRSMFVAECWFRDTVCRFTMMMIFWSWQLISELNKGNLYKQNGRGVRLVGWWWWAAIWQWQPLKRFNFGTKYVRPNFQSMSNRKKGENFKV